MHARQRYGFVRAHAHLQAPQHVCELPSRGASSERRVGRRARGPRQCRGAPFVVLPCHGVLGRGLDREHLPLELVLRLDGTVGRGEDAREDVRGPLVEGDGVGDDLLEDLLRRRVGHPPLLGERRLEQQEGRQKVQVVHARARHLRARRRARERRQCGMHVRWRAGRAGGSAGRACLLLDLPLQRAQSAVQLEHPLAVALGARLGGGETLAVVVESLARRGEIGGDQTVPLLP